jgi:hypothetical protein
MAAEGAGKTLLRGVAVWAGALGLVARCCQFYKARYDLL